MATDASSAEIRAAFRRRAHLAHPDHRGVGTVAGGTFDGGEMAEINEAYRVLSDPGRRALYDRGEARQQPRTPASEGYEPPPLRHDTFLSPSGPARWPWKSMVVAAVTGSIVVIVSSTMSGSSAVDPPDGIIEPGSCVEILDNTDAREVQCTGDGDRVVRSLVPLDGRCPAGSQAHRDRLGLGVACLEPGSDAATSGSDR